MILKRIPLPGLRNKLFILEAACALLSARLVLLGLPYRNLVSFMNRKALQPEVSGPQRFKTIHNTRWAIRRARRLLPFTMVCFPQMIAAQNMLRRRGIGLTLYYGAASDPQRGLTGHVWLQDGNRGIMGYKSRADYRVLASYPNT